MAAVANRATSNNNSNSSSSSSSNNSNKSNRSTSNMSKRYLGILFFCCFLFIWRTITDEPPPAATATSQQQQPQLQSSANGSKPNQIIHDPSRTQPLNSNLSSYSNYYYYSPSLFSLDNAATPVPSPTAATSFQPSHLPSDASQLIDLHHFGYLMEQPACEPHILALILVHTAPRNAEKRLLIRQTWGGLATIATPSPSASTSTSTPSPLRVVFLLGAVPPTEPQLQHSLEQENARFGDMVQGNFQDAYRNMTYKHVMALKWFSSHCSHAQLLIKVDDDVYVNTPQLHKLLREQQQQQQPQPLQLQLQLQQQTPQPNMNRTQSLRSLLQQPHELLFCKPVLKSRVKRSYRSKWRVSFREYPAHYYPPYCPGFAIVYSPDVVQRLYQAAQHSDYFWVDDVHITGVLAQRTNTTITTLQPYVLYETDCERLLSGESDLRQLEFLFTWHSISPEQVNSLWQLHVAQNYTTVQLEADVGPETGLS
ncbi:PREDICTED: beta-1,3-galactosyltransferase 1 [Drosophila arizonae]|uniref:Hexosyltransferase n=1 Tax=Drosophila arizonae TaxID=7263 RepID=A0ABM1P7U5_DROAR|nr:PREDICTED: beta-1,3-galactosyltransferase 1 [Drosophila arizonae]